MSLPPFAGPVDSSSSPFRDPSPFGVPPVATAPSPVRTLSPVRSPALHRGISRRLHLRLPILPFCPGAMVRTTEQDGALWHLFDARDVPRFFAQEKYTCFYWHAATGPEEHLLADSLDALEARLAAFAFVRTHRSELVNLRFLRRVAHTGRGGQAVMELADGQRAPISRRRLGQVRAALRRMRAVARLPDQLGVRALPV